MTLETVVQTALTVAAATGGIYTHEDTGRNGINRTTTPAAFDANGIIKPTILIRVRSEVNTYDLVGNVASTRAVLEVWFYSSDSYTTTSIMRSSVFGQLHNKQLSGTFQVIWNWDVQEARDESIDALVERSEYWAYIKKGS